MPSYLLEREVGKISIEDIKAAFDKGEEVREQIPDVRWIRSYYSVEEGKLYCEYEGPSKEVIPFRAIDVITPPPPPPTRGIR